MSGKLNPDSIIGFTSREDMQYAAGFFDGEGHCRVRFGRAANGKVYGQVHVSLGQKDRRVLDWFASIWSGSIYCYNPGSASVGNHQWTITGTRAIKFLQQIRPFVRVKDTQIDQVFKEKGISCGS